MRYNLLFFVTLFLVNLISVLKAQQINSIKAVGMPDIYQFPVPGADEKTTYTQQNRYWVVFSDRDNNKTHTLPGGNTLKKVLEFMERFWVAEVNGSYLHIYKENDPHMIWPAISATAESYGWIHKSHLLLWQHCLRNMTNYIDKKAMILNTFEGITNYAAEDQVVTYKRDPELKINSIKKSRLFEILFVYKQIDKAVLLGEDIALRGRETDILANIRGWVPIENVTFWDHRITLEPNWDQAAVNERNEKDIKPAVFIDEKAALDYKNGKKVDKKYVIWENDPGSTRNLGQWRRFPIIEQKPSQIMRTGVMGKIRTETGQIMDEERMAMIRNAMDDCEAKTRKINIVFVVDGTESMGKFYASIAQGIEKSVKELELEDTQNRLMFGSVIYRDFLEKENKIEVQRLTENHNEIIDFFNNARTDYSRDNDLPEAMYFGIKTALTMTGLRQDESNFIILIGDAGNHSRDDETQVDEAELIDLIAEYECSIISYQVNNGSNPTYNDFVDQSRRIIIQSALKDRKIREETKSKWMSDKWYPEEPFFRSTGPNRYSLNPQEVVGSFLFPGKGEVLPFTVLESEIRLKIRELDNRISEILAETREIINGAGTADPNTGETDEYQPAVVDLLSKLKGLSDNDIEMLKRINYQFSMKGYTSCKVTNMRYPVFKEVLFLSREDLLEIVTRLKGLCEIPGSMFQRRQKMQLVWIDILESMLGSNKREEIMAMTVNELNDIVFGLPSQSDFIGKVRLRDITEPTVINDTQFEIYFDYLNNKLVNLRECIHSNYRESFVSNNFFYYWIPMELFP